MAITYSIAELIDPRDPESSGKFYAKAQAAGVITIDDLADDISYSTTLTDGDVLNVIRALIKQIQKHIQNGNIVRLENLGSFQVQIRSKGSPTREEYTTDLIKSVHLQFRPGKGLNSALQLSSLKFKRVKGLKEDAEPDMGV
jgi:predicted histone-like DNA-binding protein